MEKEDHYRALEKMYLAAPINELYKPGITVSEATAEIRMDVKEAFFHAAGAVHGSVYFKMLDDAAYFAASSVVQDFFVLTTAFTTYLTRPVSSGTMTSIGKVANRTRTQIIAESVVYNDLGKEVGRGSGIFVKGKTPLSETLGYNDWP